MANTEPTGGPVELDPNMLRPESADEQAKFDKALEDAFGPQGQQQYDGQTSEEEITQEPGADNQAPDPGASGEGEEGEGGEDGGQTSGAIGGDAADFAALFRNRYNRDPEPGELEGYIALAEWAAQLTPEQQVAINNALADPARYVAPQYQQQAPITPEPSVDPEYAALVEEFGEDHPLVKKIKALESSQQQVVGNSIR